MELAVQAKTATLANAALVIEEISAKSVKYLAWFHFIASFYIFLLYILHSISCDLIVIYFVLVDGSWAPWQPFTRCNAACLKTRKRICNQPAPSTIGGAKCTGGNGLVQNQRLKCNPRFCGKP